jgi:membrane protease subunit HflK
MTNTENESRDISTQKDTNMPEGVYKAVSDALRSSFRILQILMVLAVLFFFLSSIFTVEQYESAIVLRFGRIRGTLADRVLSPGLHWAVPYPVDEVIKIPTGRISTLNIDGFWQEAPVDRLREVQIRPTLRPDVDGYVLTSDTNVLHINLIVRYRISDPVAYLQIANPQHILSTIVESETVRICASIPVDTILIERGRITELIKNLVDEQLEKANIGLTVERIDLVGISPPQFLRADFEEVIIAGQERGRVIQEALAYYSRTVEQAGGEAVAIVEQANIYKSSMIQEVRADASYLKSILEKYRENPDIIRQSLLHDTLKRVLPETEKYIIKRTAPYDEIRVLIGREVR